MFKLTKVVMYLSGKKKSAQWHAECDSVAASVSIPKKYQEKFYDYFDMCGFIQPVEGYLDWVVTGGLADMCSDLIDNDDKYSATAKELMELCNCEFDCGAVHFFIEGK